MGRTDIEDALKRLEELSRDEALMAAVQVMRVTDRVDHRMEEVVDGTQGAFWLVFTNLTVHTLSDATDRERSW